jgi:hypothetical protein
LRQSELLKLSHLKEALEMVILKIPTVEIPDISNMKHESQVIEEESLSCFTKMVMRLQMNN